MKFTPDLRKLQDSVTQKDWIPQEGDIYAWNESTTRHGDLHFGKVISYDEVKKLVRGYTGMGTERRYKDEVFLIPPVVASQLKLDYLDKKPDITKVIPTENKANDDWSDIWPTQEGTYWFYGWRFGRKGLSGKMDYREPELCFVEVRKEKNFIMYITRGHFLDKKENAEGKWLKATLPELPKDTK
jgi:hypothetical protein